MGKYSKPDIEFSDLKSNENISSLNDWLNSSGIEYQDAGITTYTIIS